MIREIEDQATGLLHHKARAANIRTHEEEYIHIKKETVKRVMRRIGIATATTITVYPLITIGYVIRYYKEREVYFVKREKKKKKKS